MKVIRTGLLLLGLVSLAAPGAAQTPLDKSPMDRATRISCYYFGPNAFPIPDMSDGRTAGRFRVESSGSVFFGKRGDRTADVSLKASVPLWTDRASLSLWMPLTEWWRNTEENIAACRISDAYRAEAVRGHMPGDLYVGLEMQVLRQGRSPVDGVVRSVLKTASGGGYHLARYYDSPGYFFDASFSRAFRLETGELRFGLSTGFLCWQTDNGRQNDAVMYGMTVGYEGGRIMLSCTLGGYSGWEHHVRDGRETAHDRPMSQKIRLAWKMNRWEVLMGGQVGIRDYPYRQIWLGLAYNILNKK